MLRRILLSATAVSLLLLTGACSRWEPVLVEEFSSEEALGGWQLDGVADLSIQQEGDTRFLRIATRPYPGRKRGQSTLWHTDPVRGEDIRFVFRARGDEKNRSIFFFNAQPTRDTDRTIFDWKREDAQYDQYAGCDRIELYTIGFLRYDQDVCNLRYLGGESGARAHNLKDRKTPDGKPAFAGKFQDFFAKASVFGPYPSVYASKAPGNWFEIDLRVEGRRITAFVDGEQVLCVEDKGHAELPEYAWQPLTDGGWFAFRNFLTNNVDIDYLRVYRRK